ncbi:MAG: MFS transporter [SAR202 cluster bacterium]|nr:MFS transporter [SAR202 cluster bacterium]
MSYRARILLTQWLFDIAGPMHIVGMLLLLPFIQADLEVARTTVIWMYIAYTLTTAAMLLPMAFLGNTLGRRRLVLFGVAIDMLSQLGLFLAPSFSMLVAIRAIGGIGNAITVSNLPPLAVVAWPRERRGQVLGLMSIGIGIGQVAQTLVVGVVADNFGWRYLLLITAFMYALLWLVVFLVAKESSTTGNERFSLRTFDYLGVVFIGGFLAALTLGAQRFAAAGTRALGLALLGAAIVSGAAFILNERRSPRPLIDLGLFKGGIFGLTIGRQVAGALLLATLNTLLPFYFVQGLGWSGSHAGLVLVAFTIGRPVMGPISGYLADRVGPGKPALAAIVLMIVGCALLVTLGEEPPPWRIVVSLFVVGSGFSMFIPPNQRIIFSSVPAEKLSLAPAVFVLTGHGSNSIGGALAATLLGLFLAGGIAAAFTQSLGVMLAFFAAVALPTSALIARRSRPSRAERETGG